MIGYQDIKQVHLEISTRCNAACPDCPRNFRGADVDLPYPVVDMRLDQAKKIFDIGFLSQLRRMLICGNFGDFIAARDGLEIVEYFRSSNPRMEIRISTNASGRPDIWGPLAKLGVIVHFRLDGLEDTHHLYRQYTNYDLILSNARKFIEAGGQAIWSFIIFDHNKHQMQECQKLSQELGFEGFEVIDDSRNTFPVFDRRGNFSHNVGNYQGSTKLDEIFKPTEFDINRYQSSEYVDCYAVRNQEIYVAANGEVFPCCWLGFYPTQGFKPSFDFQLIPLVKENNALDHGIKHAIEWFGSIEETWSKDSVADGRLLRCDQNCGRCKNGIRH